MMNLEIKRVNGMINMYEADDKELLFTVDFLYKGRFSEDNVIKYIIGSIYKNEVNPRYCELKRIKAKNARSVNYLAKNTDMNPEKREVYINKIIDTKQQMNDLESDIKEWKRIISNLYNCYPQEYLDGLYVKRLETQIEKLKEQLESVNNQLNNCKNTVL